MPGLIIFNHVFQHGPSMQFFDHRLVSHDLVIRAGIRCPLVTVVWLTFPHVVFSPKSMI